MPVAQKTVRRAARDPSDTVTCQDLGRGSPDLDTLKSALATEIVKALDHDHLSVREAHERTGVAAADFSRIRNADLGRFTADRLMSIIYRLGSQVDIAVKVRRRPGPRHSVTTRGSATKP